jgi:hypothetical protein
LVRLRGRLDVEATIAGGAAPFDTAYAERDLGRNGVRRLVVRETISLSAAALAGDIDILQVRSIRNVVTLAVFIDSEDKTIGLFSPVGGVAAKQIKVSTGVPLDENGLSSRRLVLSLEVGKSVSLSVDGVRRLRLTRLDSPFTRIPRWVRSGITAYESELVPDPVTVHHRRASMVAKR